MSTLKIIAILLALYALYDVARTLALWWPNRRLIGLAVKHQKMALAKLLINLTANLLAAIILFKFAVG